MVTAAEKETRTCIFSLFILFLFLAKEKRKRQAAIEDKRQQLEDQILQLQHLKSKSLREKWLMQGAPVGTVEEEEARKRQCEDDELKLKSLEENVQRLEQDIEQLESEESIISAKEQILREKLKETEISFVDLQKSLSNQNKDAVNYIYSQIPDLTNLYSHQPETSLVCDRTARVAAMYAMEINVEKDRKTGETKILSAAAVDPEVVQQRGVKVYDDGNKVVYELHHAGAIVENGVHKLSTRDVDDLIQKSAQSNIVAGHDTLPGRTVLTEGISSHMKEQLHFKEAKLEMVHKSNKGFPVKPGQQHVRSAGNSVNEATLEQPVTMIFMGYQNIDDEEETKKVLGYDDTIKAELVLIDEDDEKSLREKTVTDVSTMDGNAAELVSGKLLTETTEPSSPEGKDESLATEPITGLRKKTVQFKDPEGSEEIEEDSLQFTRPPIPQDEINLKKDKDQISANHSQPVDIILTSNEAMEFEVQVSESKGVIVVTPDVAVDNQSTLLSAAMNQNGLKDRHESLDSDVAKEIQYLDEVLEANCCDTAPDNPFNGSSSPERTSTITVDGSGPYVCVTNDCFAPEMDVIAVDRKPQPVVEMNEPTEIMKPININGHSEGEMKDDHTDVFTYPANPDSSNSSRRSSKDGETVPKTIKKEAKFELRAFHEEKKPSKLFEDLNEKEHFRVRKVRPSEEVIELEKERLDLIKSQAVKKNPSIATKWWNPPQEKTIEEQLDCEHLESHLRYKERKQKQQEQGISPPPVKSDPQPILSSETPAVNKEDIVTEQIDFSAARKQFLNMENTSQINVKAPPKRSVAPNFYSVKPFYKVSHANKPQSSITVTNQSSQCVEMAQPDEIALVRGEKVHSAFEDQQWTAASHLPELSADNFEKTLEEDSQFVSATATFTVVKDDEIDVSDHFMKSLTMSSLPEELDSGLDDLSVKSQDTTVMETLSNDFSMDNISDSGASYETINTLHEHSLADFSQPQTPFNDTPADYTVEGISKSFSDQGFYSPSSTSHDSIISDYQLEYQAGILVNNVIQQALAEKAGITYYDNPEQPTENIDETSEQPTEQKVIVSNSITPTSLECKDDTVFHPPQVSSPVQETRSVTVTPKNIPEQEPETWKNKAPEPLSIPSTTEEDNIEENKHESYFSKYSQAAELRSTASILATQEPEITVGPFKLRSKKQRTLSMIEEEIRAAQEREQELKKQRQRQSLQSPQSPLNKNAPAMPTRTASYKTAPGKIEKVRTPTSPKGESFPTPTDDLLDDATASQRPKNLMQTLLDDYETHKSKRRDRMDDSSVLEAVRVSRRKSALALRWEAGIYANREEDE
ncbi:PALM2-AKAP2 fusion protein isoform X3 [Pseudophryne corroboree]|uniref:PALM2-AKAP2 fusion protein isoform X3 n=1 Tax=Pseudophryne corroboree TaxID=495146 RepID=UPI003081F58D